MDVGGWLDGWMGGEVDVGGPMLSLLLSQLLLLFVLLLLLLLVYHFFWSSCTV